MTLGDRGEIKTEKSTLEGNNNDRSAATDSKRRGGADHRGNAVKIVTALMLF